MLFFSAFLGSAGGFPVCAVVGGCWASWREARRATADGCTTPSPFDPLTRGALSPGPGGGATSQPVTFVIGGPPPCSGQASTGCVPEIYTSDRRAGQFGVASIPDCGSISIDTIPFGARKGFASRYSRICVACFINSAQIGAAEWAPSRSSSLLS